MQFSRLQGKKNQVAYSLTRILLRRLQRRKDQLPELKQAKRAGKIAFFVLDKLIIEDKLMI